MRILLRVVGGTVAVLWLVVLGWVAVNSRDIAPVDTSDLTLDAIRVSDANNGYIYLARAFQVFQWPKAGSAVDSMLAGKTWDDAYVADLISRNVETAALLKSGLACTICQPREELGVDKPKPLWQMRDMCKLLVLKAAYERRAGHKEEAWDACRDLLRFGALVMTDPTGVLDCILGTSALRWGFTEVQGLLGEWSPDEAHLAQFLDQLNGIEPMERGYVRVIKREFAFFTAGVDQLRSVKAHRILRSYLFQPNRTTELCAEFYRALIGCYSQPYAQTYLPEPKLPPQEGIHRYFLLLRPNSQGRILLRVLLMAPDRITQTVAVRCTTQSHLDGFRLVIACRLYEIRHGQLPQTLDELVPGLLGAVPPDPFDGKPFRYSREDAVVYSVGMDLKDAWSTGERAADVLLSRGDSGKVDDLVYRIHAQTD